MSGLRVCDVQDMRLDHFLDSYLFSLDDDGYISRTGGRNVYDCEEELIQDIIDAHEAMVGEWNLENIYDLIRILEELEILADIREQALSEIINLEEIPSMSIPPELQQKNRMPIWAVDKRGYCLCGKHVDTVDSISEMLSRIVDNAISKEEKK